MDKDNMKYDGELIIKDERIKIQIKDEDGIELCVAKFDVKDLTSYNKICSFFTDLKEIYKLGKDLSNKELKAPQNIKNPKDLNKLNNDDIDLYFQEMDDIFIAINDFTDELKEKVKSLITNLDDVFGKGVCNAILQDGYNFEKIVPLIEIAMPYFQKERESKTSAYKRTEKSGVLK